MLVEGGVKVLAELRIAKVACHFAGGGVFGKGGVTVFCRGTGEWENKHYFYQQPFSSIVVASVPSHIRTSVRTSTSGHGFAAGGFARKSGAEDVRCYVDMLDALAHSALSHDAVYDEILEDDYATASRSEEIDLTFFPLAPSPYVIPYPFDGKYSPPYTRALDRTITPAKLRRTESLLPLELLNRVSVLSALIISHGMELNTCYTNLVASKARTEDKLMRKSGYVKELRSEVTTLGCLVCKLLFSDEFNAALAHVLTLGITSGFKRGLRMGRTDAEFEVAAQNVSNFIVGAEAEFNKALVVFSIYLIPFP
uniref:Uncharacterized protein n=1 Tax=Tanacetum cinerariifolium TaxID=118510 RepID=A0A6L2J431_TANCI|nr:hypothetical protein [Tanacetum cinerariifolium]